MSNSVTFLTVMVLNGKNLAKCQAPDGKTLGFSFDGFSCNDLDTGVMELGLHLLCTA